MVSEKCDTRNIRDIFLIIFTLALHFWCLVLQVSLTRSPPLRSVDDQGEGLLLNSYDRTLVIKQISSEDVADMHNILSEYHQVRFGWLKEKSGDI